MALSTFLFDLDGTIIDSIELILRSYRHTMALHRSNEPMPPDEMWIQGLGTPLWAQFGQITEDKEEIEAMVQTYRTSTSRTTMRWFDRMKESSKKYGA